MPYLRRHNTHQQLAAQFIELRGYLQALAIIYTCFEQTGHSMSALATLASPVFDGLRFMAILDWHVCAEGRAINIKVAVADCPGNAK